MFRLLFEFLNKIGCRLSVKGAGIKSIYTYIYDMNLEKVHELKVET